VQNPASFKPFLLERSLDFLGRLAAVDDDRQIEVLGQRKLLAEDMNLLLRRRKAVKKIQPDLSHSADSSGEGEIPDFLDRLLGEIFGLMRVDTRRRYYLRKPLSQIQGCSDALRVGHLYGTAHGADPFRAGLPDNIIAVRIELRHIEVGVGINQPGASCQNPYSMILIFR
jgi:hypothetical protein